MRRSHALEEPTVSLPHSESPAPGHLLPGLLHPCSLCLLGKWGIMLIWVGGMLFRSTGRLAGALHAFVGLDVKQVSLGDSHFVKT